MEKYYIDFVKNTFTITKAFEDKMQDFASEEFAFYRKTLAEIPGIVVKRRTHKTPTKYVNKSNETFHCNQFKNLNHHFFQLLMKKEKELKKKLILKNQKLI